MTEPRLFSALVPPEPVAADLSRRLDRVADLRWVPEGSWHVTLGYYGAGDDPARRTEWLHDRLTGLPAPRLRLAGSGRFGGTLWAGLDTESGQAAQAFQQLANAAGAGSPEREYRPHLTLARLRPSSARDAVADQLLRLAEYRSPLWTPGEVVLLASTGARGDDPEYTVVTTVLLAS